MNPVMKKFELAQKIAEAAFGFYSLAELEHLLTLIEERRHLANKASFATLNAVTGKSAEAANKALKKNETEIKTFASDTDWLEN